MSPKTRRSFLKRAGATALAAGAVPGLAAADEGFTVVETPTAEDLYDVVRATDGAYAAGSGGVALERTADGWRTLFDGGVSGNGNGLYGASVTDDGERVWFVGASGAVGEYDVIADTLYDRSNPLDSGNNFNDVAVTGPAGEANVYVAGDSGKVFYSFENGETETWEYVTPGSGSGLSAIDFHDDRAGHVVDTNQKVFATDDGSTWEPVGIADANVNFYGVDSDGADDVYVSGGNGSVFDLTDAAWELSNLGDASLRDVEVGAAGDAGLTVGGGGKVFELGADGWTQLSTPTGANLKAVLRGGTDVAVGAAGTVIER